MYTHIYVCIYIYKHITENQVIIGRGHVDRVADGFVDNVDPHVHEGYVASCVCVCVCVRARVCVW